MKLYTLSKDAKRLSPQLNMYMVAALWASGDRADYLELNNIVRYASSDFRILPMDNVDGTRADFL